MATITKLQSGKFKAIVRRQGRTKSKTFTRKTDARTWAKNLEADREKVNAMGLAGAAVTFRDLADLYLADWKGRDQSLGFKVKFWVEALGGEKLTNITPGMIRKALREYGNGAALRGDGVDENGKPKLTHAGRKRSPATVNRMKSAVSAIFKYAIEKSVGDESKEDKRLLEVNPARDIPTRPENNKRRRFLSDDERTALLAACETSSWPRLYVLVMLALTTGARQGELLGLRWSNIDFKKRRAYLAMTKNGEPRVLTLPLPAIDALEQFRPRPCACGCGGTVSGADKLPGHAERTPGNVVELHSVAAAENTRVFPSELRFDQPFEFRKHWFKALQDAGIGNFRFHDLRHSAASYLAENGAKLQDIAEVLGHKSLATTLRYTHLSDKHKAELTDRIFGGIK